MIKVYKSLSKNYPYNRSKCVKCGILTTRKIGKDYVCKECDMRLEDKLDENEKELLAKLKKSDLSSKEIEILLKTKKVNSTSGKPYEYKGEQLTFGVLGDTHCGHNCYDERLMKYAAKIFNERDVDFVIHAGDLVEGHYESKREGSIFELTHIGGDQQVDYVIKQLKQIKSPLYFITGNHETNTFFKMAGFDIGKKVEEKIPESHYLGQGQGTIKLPFGNHIEVVHPDGGSSYAISYRSQKIAEAMEGGTKPAILLIGHYHKAEYLYYRNIHIFQTGCLQSQTPFMRGKHLSAHKGFWIISAEVTRAGISKLVPEFYPSY